MSDSIQITDKQRMDLGAEKKLWSIEVLLKQGHAVRRHVLNNRTDSELMGFRRNIFIAGIMLPVSPGHWVIISPADILEINVHRQERFFEP